MSEGDNKLNSTHPGTLQTLPLNFSGGEVDKNPSANVGDIGLIPGPGRVHMPGNDKICAPQILNPDSRACALQQTPLL